MKIETKYNNGDTVFFMMQNKVATGEVHQVTTSTPHFPKAETTRTQIEYLIYISLECDFYDERSKERIHHVLLREKDLFATKEELLASL